jgi:AhpD family alkylhydroperoxidase
MGEKLSGFRRRRYNRLGQFWQELTYLIQNTQKLRLALNGKNISGPFRQRLMLVVTSANRCRYCAAYHRRVSIKEGLSSLEITGILEGTKQDTCPREEIPALRYARHWAENNAQPDKAAFEELATIYGQEKAELIELVLKTIRLGNLSGNTFDYLLCRISRGWLGCPELKARSKARSRA